jgi:hypothetical protein
MVAYQRNLSRNLVRGFYFVETPAPYSFSDKQTPTDFVNGQISITISTFFTHGILAREIHETADYPPSFIEQGGACGGIVAPIELQEGSEWRRGIICVAKLSPKGYEEWSTLIQAFFFDRHLTRPSYKPGDDFEQAARKLFRSIRLRELKLNNGRPESNNPSPNKTLHLTAIRLRFMAAGEFGHCQVRLAKPAVLIMAYERPLLADWSPSQAHRSDQLNGR